MGRDRCRLRCRSVAADRQVPSGQRTPPSPATNAYLRLRPGPGEPRCALGGAEHWRCPLGAMPRQSHWPLSPPLHPPTRNPSLPSSSHPISPVNCLYDHGFIYRAFQRGCFKTVLFFLFSLKGGGSWGESERTGCRRCLRWGCRPRTPPHGAARGPLLTRGSSPYRLS